ncbi:hypothetical protein JCM13591A_37300 [Microbacterium xylanilyticum]
MQNPIILPNRSSPPEREKARRILLPSVRTRRISASECGASVRSGDRDPDMQKGRGSEDPRPLRPFDELRER